MACRKILSLALLLCSTGVCAQPSTEPLTVTLQDTLRMVAESDARLQGQKFLILESAARRAAANRGAEVTLSAEVENVLGTGSISKFNDLEATLSLGTTLELGGKRAKRTAVADRERERLEIELQAARLDVFADVAKRFLDVLHAQEDLAASAPTKSWQYVPKTL